MTEAEWLAFTDPESMLSWLISIANERKLRLFACACCRQIWSLLLDDRSREAVLASEAFADGRLRPDELATYHAAAEASFRRCEYINERLADAAAAAHRTAASTEQFDVVDVQLLAANAAAYERDDSWWADRTSNEAQWAVQARLVRDVFGNPFHPVTIGPICRTPSVVDLARTVYNEHAFDRMHELTVALQQAGCADETILDHCRGPGPHVRGCWVLDLLLNKS